MTCQEGQVKVTGKISSCCTAPRPRGENKKENSRLGSHPQKVNKKGMIYIPEGTFFMGTNSGEGFPSDGEGPAHKVKINGFYIDPCAVTNEEFKTFVEETGYKTEAEDFGWSFVFYSFLSLETAKKVESIIPEMPWWAGVQGACWNKPEGPDSSINDRMDHPVVHISWNDAMAYCKWAGKRLPSEAEWEYAARGGLEQKRYPWGDVLTPNGEHQCNIWQGVFPKLNTGEDGYKGTAPVTTYSPNGYGLYNMVGNVWEWCSDWFSMDCQQRGGWLNPQGPKLGTTKVTRGGSYLCHYTYCNRYRVAARSSNYPESSAGNMGFRCAADKLI